MKGKSPFALLHGQSPSYSHIKYFDCLAYAHDHNLTKNKFRVCSRPRVFLGYLFGKKGWHLYNVEHKKFIIPRDVVFDESIFPYAIETLENKNSIPGIPRHAIENFDEEDHDILDQEDLSCAVDRGSPPLTQAENMAHRTSLNVGTSGAQCNRTGLYPFLASKV